MDENANQLLSALDDEIERKCFEIKQKKAAGILQRFFIIACVLFVAVPVLFVLMGINLWTLCIPAVLFFIACFAVLSPLLFSGNPGGLEQ